MIDYTIHYSKGEAKEVCCAGRKDLIKTYFNGDEDKFKEEVKMISWTSGDMFLTENPKKGSCSSTISSADTNPYGWRNEFSR